MEKIKDKTLANNIQPIEYCGVDGKNKFAGIHLIIELWGPSNIDNIESVRSAFEEAIDACGATMLNIDLHEFTPFGGISGVAVLQESHMSVHTWPEYSYAAMDIFVCGTVDPHKSLPVFERHFTPEKIEVTEIKRGLMPL